jgi:hypothetical protein
VSIRVRDRIRSVVSIRTSPFAGGDSSGAPTSDLILRQKLAPGARMLRLAAGLAFALTLHSHLRFPRIRAAAPASWADPARAASTSCATRRFRASNSSRTNFQLLNFAVLQGLLLIS